MKKLFKPIAVLFSAALLLTSCIDNTVSDQVNKIREAQVNLLNAQTRLREADAAFREAQARQQEALADITEAQAEEAASNADVVIAENLAAVKQAELNLAIAVEDLRLYLLTQGAESAADLLASYQEVMGDAYSAQTTIAEKQAQLAKWNLLYTSALDEIAAEGDVSAPTFALIEEKLLRDIATEEAKLAAQEEALALLEDVASGTANLVTELAELEAANQELENQELEKEVEITKANNDVTDAGDAVDELTSEDVDDNGDIIGIIPFFEDAEDDKATAEADKAAAEVDAVQANADLANAQKNYDNAKALLENYTGPLVTRFTAFNNALKTAKDRFQAVKDKIQELEVLLAQEAAGGSVTPAQITAARTAVTNAINTYEGSVGDTGYDGTTYDLAVLSSYCGGTNPTSQPGAYIADSALENANSDYNPVRNYFVNPNAAYSLIQEIGDYDENTFLGNFENGGGVLANIPLDATTDGGTLLETLNNAQDAADTKQEAIDDAQADIDDAQAIIDANQDAYDAAILALPGLEAALDAAKDAKDALVAEKAVITTQKGQNQLVIDDLTALLDLGPDETAVESAANKLIEDKKDAIEATKDAIAALQEMLDNNTINVAKVQAYIEALEADIAERQGELEAIQAIAAEYLALLMDELG